MNKQFSRHFYLFSFLPALLYWYLESHYPVKVAVLGGVGLALLEIAVEKIWLKKVHQLSIFNVVLMVLLGGLSFFGEEGIWFKLQPFFTGLGISGYIFIQLYRGKGLLQTMVKEMNPQMQLPDWILVVLERNLAVMILLNAVVMAALALWSSTGTWAFFKTTGIYFFFVPFLLGHFFWIRFKVRKMQQHQLRQQAIAAHIIKK